jgi:crotonobetainyl-CoA:carnitine CoA-transferase CaiB-like acyl-CoA transferase
VSNALDGIRVVDLSNGLAGNSCTKLLADLGADVVKLESPDRGDFTRTLVPWVFETFNRNKRSFAVDLRRAEGRDLALRLIETADVFIQTLHPDAAESMGLGRAAVTARNPRIIHVSLSAFGATGPSSQRKAVDVVIQAESGLSTVQGQLLTNGSFVDATAGLHLLSGIMAALFKRERTGEVDHVTVNLLDAALYLESVPFAEFSATGNVIDPRAYARRFPTVSVFEAADGPFFLGAYWEDQWERLCALVGRPDLATDGRFATKETRSENVAELRAELTSAFGRRPRSDWVRDFNERDIMAGTVNSFADVAADEQVAVNESLERLRLRDGREATFVRPAFRFGDQWKQSAPAPDIGADSAALLTELGVPVDERQQLVAAGVVGIAGEVR